MDDTDHGAKGHAFNSAEGHPFDDAEGGHADYGTERDNSDHESDVPDHDADHAEGDDSDDPEERDDPVAYGAEGCDAASDTEDCDPYAASDAEGGRLRPQGQTILPISSQRQPHVGQTGEQLGGPAASLIPS